jgi:hypothetical protein
VLTVFGDGADINAIGDHGRDPGPELRLLFRLG